MWDLIVKIVVGLLGWFFKTMPILRLDYKIKLKSVCNGSEVWCDVQIGIENVGNKSIDSCTFIVQKIENYTFSQWGIDGNGNYDWDKMKDRGKYCNKKSLQAKEFSAVNAVDVSYYLNKPNNDIKDLKIDYEILYDGKKYKHNKVIKKEDIEKGVLDEYKRLYKCKIN